MKHRLLTTLVGTILCLGWCMSANAQKDFYMCTKVNGKTMYLNFDSNEHMYMQETPKTIWTFTKNSSNKFDITYKSGSTTYHIGYKGESDDKGKNNYGFLPRTSADSYLYWILDATGSAITSYDDMSSGHYYYFGRAKNGVTGNNNYMAGVQTKYYDGRLDRTEGSNTAIISIGSNGVDCANIGYLFPLSSFIGNIING